MGLEIDMSALPPGVVEEFRKGRVAREALAICKAPRAQDLQARHAAEAQWKSMDGLGRPRMVIDTTAYHYWGRRLGYDCWRDKQFLAEFERDNPAVRIKAAGTRIQVGYHGPRKFTKTY